MFAQLPRVVVCSTVVNRPLRTRMPTWYHEVLDLLTILPRPDVHEDVDQRVRDELSRLLPEQPKVERSGIRLDLDRVRILAVSVCRQDVRPDRAPGSRRCDQAYLTYSSDATRYTPRIPVNCPSVGTILSPTSLATERRLSPYAPVGLFGLFSLCNTA